MTSSTRDSSLHPFSGSRRQFVALADRLVDAARRHASPSGSLLRLPGPQSGSGAWSDGLEGYARTLLAVAFRAADGSAPRALEHYAKGLAAGVDPDHPERWPRMTERRQAVVEGASIAIALSETRPWLWELLDERTKQNAIDWFSDVLGMSGFGNNWLWFQNVMEAFLASVGGAESRADRDRNDELAEALYVGDGWYSDGRGRDGERQSFDWYAGWAWHIYPLLESRIRGRELADTHRERLAAYLDQARSLVGSDGSPVLIGRSATYRFATLAPFWAGAVAGVTPLAPGVTRAMSARMIDGFLRSGAVRDDGLLSIGWHGAFPRIRQLYTGSASPYWASKAFLGLLLPADHPEWTAAPAQDPVPRQRGLTAPGWIVSEAPADGIVRVVNHGSDRLAESRLQAHADDAFYRRVGYSNVTSPQLGADAVADPRESHTTLLNAHDRTAHRDGIERVLLTDRVAVSRSRVHWLDPASLDWQGRDGLTLGPRLTVASVVNGSAELRLAWWRSVPEATGRAAAAIDLESEAAWPRDAGPWRVWFGGWPLADPDSPVPPAGEPEVRVVSEDPIRPSAAVSSERARSRVTGVVRVDRAGLIARRGSDPFGDVSETPAAFSSTPLPEGRGAAALVALTGAGAADAPVPTLAVTGAGIEVRWPDGPIDVVPTDGEVAL